MWILVQDVQVLSTMTGSHADPGGVVVHLNPCDADIGGIVQQGPGVHVHCQVVMCQ